MAETPKQPTVFDAGQQALATIYARALVGVGEGAGTTEQLVGELESVAAVVQEVPALKSALESPRIAADEKIKMVDKAFKGRVDQSVLNFLRVLGNKGRFDCLPAIGTTARKLFDEMSGTVEATLTTAGPVDQSVRDEVSKKLAKVLNKGVSLNSVVDPSIIGGMVVRVGDTVYDNSVVNQLKQVRSRAYKSASDAIREKLESFASE